MVEVKILDVDICDLEVKVKVNSPSSLRAFAVYITGIPTMTRPLALHMYFIRNCSN